MTNEELFKWCCNQECENGPYGQCDLCMYKKGKLDTINNLCYMFNYDLFKTYSNDERFISFNNLSLMIKDMIEELKGEQ